MSTNRLAREKSPYLLQHADNPVDWFPWGDEAFAKAQTDAANALADKHLAINARAATAAMRSAWAAWGAFSAALILVALTAFQVWQTQHPIQVIITEPVATIPQSTPTPYRP